MEGQAPVHLRANQLPSSASSSTTTRASTYLKPGPSFAVDCSFLPSQAMGIDVPVVGESLLSLPRNRLTSSPTPSRRMTAAAFLRTVTTFTPRLRSSFEAEAGPGKTP